jgi:hypothetical protein
VCKGKFFSESIFPKSATIKIKDLKKGDMVFDRSSDRYGICTEFSDGLMIKRPLRIFDCVELKLVKDNDTSSFRETITKFQLFKYYDSTITNKDGIFYI